MNTTTKAIAGVLIAVVVLYGGYRIYHHFTYKAPTPVPVATVTPTASPSPEAMTNSIYKMSTDTKGVSFLTDDKGMTLYTFAKDTKGVSNCSGTCIKNWPAYGPKVAPSPSELPANLTVITRSDSTLQYAYKDMPLYYYISDKAAGDMTGAEIANWALAK